MDLVPERILRVEPVEQRRHCLIHGLIVVLVRLLILCLAALAETQSLQAFLRRH